TLDVWTDRRLRSYIGITLHTFVDDELKSDLLSFAPLKGHHTADVLLAEFEKVINYYHIEKKLVRLITDNAVNNIKAFDDILLPGFETYFENDDCNDDTNGSLQNNNDDDDCEEIFNDDSYDRFELVPLADDIIQCVSENLELLRSPCFAHTLQLVVKDGIKHASNATAALTKVAKIAKFGHSSTLFAEKIDKLSKTIPRATKCCWNSQFLTVTAVLNIPIMILNDILTELNKKELYLTEKNKEVLDEFMTLLCLFNEATVLTQADQTVTISIVGPVLLNLLNDCIVKINTNANTSCLYGDPIFLMSPVLDGRFKFQWINDCDLLSDLTKNNIILTIKQYIIDACILNSKNNIINDDVQVIPEEASSNNKNATFSDKGNKKCLFPTLKVGSFKKTKVDNSTPISVSSEIDKADACTDIESNYGDNVNDNAPLANNNKKKTIVQNKKKKKQRVYLEPHRIMRYMQDNFSAIIGARGNQAYILAATPVHDEWISNNCDLQAWRNYFKMGTENKYWSKEVIQRMKKHDDIINSRFIQNKINRLTTNIAQVNASISGL
ncbi:unnamed protein product, partial [Didymodactylos carnosus]